MKENSFSSETTNFKSIEKYYRCACKAKVKHQNKYDQIAYYVCKNILHIYIFTIFFKKTQAHT